MDKLDIKEVKKILKMKPQKFYDYFLETICSNDTVWLATSDESIIIYGDEETGLAIPLWSEEALVVHSFGEEIEDIELTPIDIEFLVNEFAPEMIGFDYEVAIVRGDSHLSTDFVSLIESIDEFSQILSEGKYSPRIYDAVDINFADAIANMRIEYQLREKNDNLTKPDWIREDDGLYETYIHETEIFNEGDIVYASILQANEELFEADDENSPASIIFSTNPFFNQHPYELRVLADKLYSYKNTEIFEEELRHVVNIISDDYDRSFNVPLPHSFTDNRDVFLTTIMVERVHIPGKKISASIIPILVNPGLLNPATILPKKYWPSIFIKHFIDGEEPETADEDINSSQKELSKNILSLSKEDQYKYFLNIIVRDETIWMMLKDSKTAIIKNDMDTKLVPLWPKLDMAEAHCINEWKGYEATGIDTYKFSAGYTAKLKDSGYKAAVMYNDGQYIEIDFVTLEQDIEDAIVSMF